MAVPKFVEIPSLPLERYEPLLGPDRYAPFAAAAERARSEFDGLAIWHVNSTARGGGVAEILHALLPYVRGAGVDTRWAVLREAEEFFVLTKRLHNNLHGDPGDGGGLGEKERRVYEATLTHSAGHLTRLLQPGDVVYLHDPQTAGLVPAMLEHGAKVIWRCHIGVDRANDVCHRAWDFLRPYVEDAHAFVFSRREYVWDGLDGGRAWLMPPAIDPFSPKNQELERGTATAILQQIGLVADGVAHAPAFHRADGTPDRVERGAEVLQEEPLPADAELVAQVSRWDRLKDPRGLLECFERGLSDTEAHLTLVGPATEAVADDPEGAVVYNEIAEAWRRMPAKRRRRAHLVSLPMFDLEENAAMVNAVQRRAEVLVQKSLAEGFGLVVAEGMWKERPFVASRVGGIQDQIVDGESGLLIGDPTDLDAFGAAISGLLGDGPRSARLGAEAKRRVEDRFLGIGRLAEYVESVASLVRDS